MTLNVQTADLVEDCNTSDADNKVRISLTMDRIFLEKLDGSRGSVNRSQYIETCLKNSNVVDAGSLRQERKLNGAVYTPKFLADYLAEKIVHFLPANLKKRDSLCNLKILDPACGDGELLSSIFYKLQESHDGDVSAKDILFGVDSDRKAIKGAKTRLNRLSKGNCLEGNLFCTNALFPDKTVSANKGWKSLLKNAGVDGGFDIVLANPPWGADVTEYSENLAKGDYQLFKGQCDTSDLFLEMSLRIVKESGLIAFIIPDSIFNHERDVLRKFLLDNSKILFIARLGEKFFEDVNRACSIIICQKSSNKKIEEQHKVNCFRLTHRLRKEIMKGVITLSEAERRLSHSVSEHRFHENKKSLFNIELRFGEENILSKFDSTGFCIGDFLNSSRGVELSKTGRVIQCYECLKWMPRPVKESHKCQHCKEIIHVSECKSENIISRENIKGYKPLVVGGAISRYKLDQPYWMNSDVDGINYKNISIYDGPKIVVRKTGVGISATMDYENAFTNQVVYIFKVKEDVSMDLGEEIFLALLNSRAIYYYLVKSNGETEWRTHPYLTQKQVLSLPSPDFKGWDKKNKIMLNRVKGIIKTALNEKRDITLEEDIIIERFAAHAYGLSEEDYHAIFDVLGSVEQLIPVKKLRNLDISHIWGE